MALDMCCGCFATTSVSSPGKLRFFTEASENRSWAGARLNVFNNTGVGSRTGLAKFTFTGKVPGFVKKYWVSNEAGPQSGPTVVEFLLPNLKV